MKRNDLLKYLFTLLFAVVMVFALEAKVFAATPGWEDLKSFDGITKRTKVYTELDVTGDKKKDTIKVVYTPKGDMSDPDFVDGEIKILVNGKRVFKEARYGSPQWAIRLIWLKNGKVIFYISSTVGSGDNGEAGLYQYQSGKLRQLYDLDKFTDGAGGDADGYTIQKVTGNKIVIERSTQFHLTGMLYYNMTLVYKNGKLKLASNQMKTTGRFSQSIATGNGNGWTAAYTMKVYNKAGSKKVAFKIKKGSKIEFKKVIYKNNKFYFQIRELSGKKRTGYIQNPKASKYPFYFEECVFVG